MSRLSTGRDRPVLLANPGGPAAPGLFHPLDWDSRADGRLSQRYDLIGFDPRGVGRSGQLDCGLDEQTAGLATGGAAPRTLELDADVARRIAGRCAATVGPDLPLYTTANTARDIEMIRKALGRDRISFLGASYGTELAVAFATLFPGATDRVVLNALQDVTVPFVQADRQVVVAVDARFTEVTAAIAARDDEFHLGATPERVRAVYLRIQTDLERRPVVIGGESVDAALLQSAQLNPAIADDAGIESLAWTLTYLARAPGAPSDRELLERLGTGGGSSGLTYGQTLSQNVSAYFAIRCDDAAWPRGVAPYAEAVAQEVSRYPHSRGRWSRIAPCAFWPNPPREEPLTITDAGWTGGPNLLVLQNTRDYRAAPLGVEHSRAALGRRAVTVTSEGLSHGVYWSEDCARDRALAWLLDGELPARPQVPC